MSCGIEPAKNEIISREVTLETHLEDFEITDRSEWDINIDVTEKNDFRFGKFGAVESSIIFSYFGPAVLTIQMLQKLSRQARNLAFAMAKSSQLSVSPLKNLIGRAL